DKGNRVGGSGPELRAAALRKENAHAAEHAGRAAKFARPQAVRAHQPGDAGAARCHSRASAMVPRRIQGDAPRQHGTPLVTALRDTAAGTFETHLKRNCGTAKSFLSDLSDSFIA